MNSHLKVFAVVAAMALLVPAGASAKRPEDKPVKGHKHEKVKRGGKGKEKRLKFATANLKGVVDSNDGTTMAVTVGKASGHAKACKGTTLSFDVSQARVHTADNDADGDMDASDFLAGQSVKVRAKVLKSKGRKTVCSLGGGPAIPAQAVHNRTTPQVEEDVEETDEEEALEDDEEWFEDEELLDEDEFLDEEELDEEELDEEELEETDDF